MEQVSFSGRLNEKLFTQMQWLSSPWFARHLWWVLLSVMVMAITLTEDLSTLANQFPERLAHMVPMFIFVMFMLVAPRYAIRKHWKTNALIKSRVSGTVDNDGVEWNTEHSQGVFPWHLFLKYKQSDDMVLLYMAMRSALYFPRAFFSSDNEWRKFYSIVKEQLREK